MDLMIKSKGKKKGLIIKTWERCRSMGRRGGGGGRETSHLSSNRGRISGGQEKLRHSKSWPRTTSASSASSASAAGTEEDQQEEVKENNKKHGRRVAPEGCFSVYVGPKKQRFVIRTKCLNHPLFKVLLEEAESEYGYNSEGPLELPCEVDIFIKVLIEIDDSNDIINPPRCSFGRSYSSYQLLTTSPKIAFLK